nr:PREDICTED: uncharacterized protein LOC105668605 isoform X2 [Linepithema humile]
MNNTNQIWTIICTLLISEIIVPYMTNSTKNKTCNENIQNFRLDKIIEEMSLKVEKFCISTLLSINFAILVDVIQPIWYRRLQLFFRRRQEPANRQHENGLPRDAIFADSEESENDDGYLSYVNT